MVGAEVREEDGAAAVRGRGEGVGMGGRGVGLTPFSVTSTLSRSCWGAWARKEGGRETPSSWLGEGKHQVSANLGNVGTGDNQFHARTVPSGHVYLAWGLTQLVGW